MKIEINKNELANALAALEKLVSRTSPLEVNHSILRVDHSYMALNRCFGLDGNRPALWT